MDEEAKKYWSQRILGRVVGRYKIKRYIFNRSDIPLERCEMCKKYHELLPLGPNDEWVCDDCGKKNTEIRKQKFDAIIKRREAKYAETTVHPAHKETALRLIKEGKLGNPPSNIHFHRIKKP